MKKAVVLVSGGLDSVTVLAIVKKMGFDIFPISFSYSQRHSVEIEKARKSIESLGINRHKIIDIDLSQFGGSALTDMNIDVPKYNNVKELGGDVPLTYVPARNTIFLSLSLAFAETIGSFDIFIGAHMQDSANYPDCRKEYLESFQLMANKALSATNDGKHKMNIHAPLIDMSKSEIIKTGMNLGVDYSNTISCYNATIDGLSCGKCHSCLVRLQGFAENNILDPIKYNK